MHTPAPPALLPPATVTYTGRVLRAEARSTMADAQGHTVPVLVLEIELECATRNHHRSMQLFPPGQYAQCQAAAHRYKPGLRVCVDESLADIQTVGHNTQHVHVLQPEANAA